MADAIISRDHIRTKAQAAFAAGLSRDSHNMNWHCAALTTWLHEYDRLASSLAAAKSHHATGTARRIDSAQVSSC